MPLVVAHLGLLSTFDLAARPGALYLWLGLGMSALLLASRWFRGASGPQVVELLVVAALLRVLLLPLPPTLSEDLHRYLWDGKVAGAGFDPYRLAPEAPELATLRDDRWRLLPHRQIPTIYPPLAVTLFSISARLPRPALALKSILVLADLVACWLLAGLARRLDLPRGRVLWYAWNPLVTLEVAGMGHVDALGVAACLGAAAFLLSRPARAAAAGALAAAGILAKLVPVVALPAWARQSGRPLVFVLVALGLSAVALAPVAASAGGVPPGFGTYAVSWEFNGPLFEPLWRLLEAGGVPGALAAGLDLVKSRTGHPPFLDGFYPLLYPQLLAKALLAAGLAVALAVGWRRREVVPATGVLFGHALLFSATVYPWYLLWVLPWAALTRQVAWLSLSASILLSYLPRALGVPLFPGVYLLVWGPFFVLLLLQPRWSTA